MNGQIALADSLIAE